MSYNNYRKRYNQDDLSRFLAQYAVVSSQDSSEPVPKIPKLDVDTEEAGVAAQEVVIAPSKSLTGVDEATTRICAKLSHQIYKVTDVKDFVVDGNVTPLLLDRHGPLNATTPPFGVFEIMDDEKKTLVLVWRGSMTKMDWVVDMAVAPVVSTRWSTVAPSLRAHAGYTSLVESDLALHEEWLVQQIETRGIKQILLTGHSLAGAMAQIAQVAIQAALRQRSSSPWNRLVRDDDNEQSITCRSIQFGAPMSCLLVDEDDNTDDKSLEFWKEVGSTSCNIAYGADLMPRAPGNFDYVDKAVRHALVPFLRDALPIMSIIDLFPAAQQKLIDLYQDQTKRQDVLEIIQVCGMFRHSGSIIYYESIEKAPVKLGDYQFRTDRKYQYHASPPEVEPYPNRKLREHHRKFPAVLAETKE